MTTIQDLLADAHRVLTGDDARQESEWLMDACCGIGRARQVAHPDATVPADKVDQFRSALQRRHSGEPLAYIIGKRDFWDMQLYVTPDVLIPQPDTEVLVEQALARIPDNAAWRIADLGTGSGAIALALAKERPACQLVASDASAAALSVAARNVKACRVSNVSLINTSWLAPLGPGSLDMIVSNPPYVADDDPCLLEGDVSREPRQALVAGPEGLDELEQIIRDSAHALKEDGWLLVEHGHDQASAVATMLASYGYREVFTLQDYGGNDRVSGGKRDDADHCTETL
jgi:release factor glutamine methyltransferase